MSSEGQVLPSSFGRYTLTDRLAIGGMAEVFKAKMSSAHGFEKILVIKRILPHLSGDKNFVSMFIDEAKLTAQLTHPKIVQVIDFGEVSEQLFIALEFIDGFDALALLRNCAHRRIRLPFHLGLFVVMEMLDALDYAHNARDVEGRPMKLVHRDISPSNVFIARRGDVKLGDFGIAHAQERESKTQAGTLKGKYGYMSPEQVTGQKLDGRSDIFAVGIVLAEMLMGRRLFTAANDLDVLLMVRDGRLERLDKYCKDLAPELDTIVRKALKRELGERFQTAADFRDALSDFLFHVGRRVGPSDLGTFSRDLFDPSPEALQRLVEAQNKATMPSPRKPIAAPEIAPPRPTDPSPVSHSPPVAEQDEADESEGESDALDAGPDGTPAGGAEDELVIVDDSDSPPADLVRGTPPAALPGMAALDDMLSQPLAVVDLDQWGSSDPGPPPMMAPPAARGGRSITGQNSVPPGSGSGARGIVVTPGPNLGVPEPAYVRRPAAATARVPAAGAVPPVYIPADLGRFTPGAPRRSPDHAGSLPSVSPMRVLAELAVARETGLIHFESGTQIKEIYLVQGAPESVNSNLPNERFGEYLVAHGFITAEELKTALGMLPRFSGKMGDTLVGLGIMRPLDVFRVLSQQVRDRVIELFRWSHGTYGFYRGVTNAHEAFPLGLDTFEILGGGVLVLPPEFLEDKFRPLMDARPCAVGESQITPDMFRLGPTPRELHSMLDGRRRLIDWITHFPSPDERLTFLRTLYLLVETDLASFD